MFDAGAMETPNRRPWRRHLRFSVQGLIVLVLLREREFRRQHAHLSCFFQGTELRDSLGSGERSARQDAVGISVIQTALSAGSMTAVDRSPPQLLQKQQDGKFEGGE